MRRVWTSVVLLTLCMAVGAWGHAWNNALFFAVQFPDENVPVVDGNLADWAVVPDVPYLIGSEVLADSYYANNEQGEIDVSDMAIRSFWGWNDNNDRLYAMAEVFDDRHVVDRSAPDEWWADDAWEIYIDVAHLDIDEQRWEDGTKQSWNVSVPIAADNLGQMLPAHAWRTDPDTSPYWGFGWSFEGEEYGESTYFYEIWMQPFEFIAEDGNLDNSPLAELEVDQLIHMSMAFDDDDDGGTERTNFWTTTDGGCCKADSDMILNELDDSIDWGSQEGTAVQSDSWARIKSQFITQ